MRVSPDRVPIPRVRTACDIDISCILVAFMAAGLFLVMCGSGDYGI